MEWLFHPANQTGADQGQTRSDATAAIAGKLPPLAFRRIFTGSLFWIGMFSGRGKWRLFKAAESGPATENFQDKRNHAPNVFSPTAQHCDPRGYVFSLFAGK